VAIPEGDFDLLERWVRASFSIGRIGQDPLGGYLTTYIQAAGTLDTKLRAFDERYVSESATQNELGTIEIAFLMTEHLYLSRLWVLDAYELIRTLDACIASGSWSPSTRIKRRVGQVKTELAEVRVPLAKLEPAKHSRGASPGDLIAQPALVPGMGAAWNVGPTTVRIVTRRELSDAVLTLLEAARAEA
jgi:hypothetical protein